MRFPTIILLGCVVLVLIAAGLRGQTADSQDTATMGQEERINALLIQRRDALRQLVEVVTRAYEDARILYEDVVEAENRLLKAELQLADTQEARVRIYEERLDKLRKLEDLVTQRHKLGQLTTDKVLNAKAARLAAEIELLRAQANGE